MLQVSSSFLLGVHVSSSLETLNRTNDEVCGAWLEPCSACCTAIDHLNHQFVLLAILDSIAVVADTRATRVSFLRVHATKVVLVSVIRA